MAFPSRRLFRVRLPRPAFGLLALAACAFATACTQSSPTTPDAATGISPVESIAAGDTLYDPVLGAPVDLVRDEWGIPHIYGKNIADVIFAEGYVMAQDRFVLMDLARHQAGGTLSELVGGLSPSVVDTDIQMRVHHMRATAALEWAELSASSDAADQKLVKILRSFSAGVNAAVAELKSGKYSLPIALNFVYLPTTAAPWTEVDSLLLGQLQAFSLAFDAGSEIARSQLDAAGTALFDTASDPLLKARAGLAKDLQILAPLDPTYTISGWTGMNGDTSTASLRPPSSTPSRVCPGAGPGLDPGLGGGNLLALLTADRPTVEGIGHDHLVHPDIGSNNWIVGPALSATGHTLVANDTHLALGNPATFYLVHLVAGGDTPVDVMGVQFAGIPGVILGMNEHVAWGATVNYIDVTDVYEETIVTCDGGQGPCVLFQGKKVPLVPRKESFKIGKYGTISSTVDLTFYDVPHHGPLVPRITAGHRLEPLGGTELSIRYTGYEPAQLFRAVWGVDQAKTMKEAVSALDRDFKYGNQNWVIGDDQGNFGWTQTIRVPRRAKGYAPWKVLPGDGSAEWGPDMDPKYIPHAYNPAAGFLATANADPIGVTDDGDPFFDEPTVDGAPLYLGADYDAGTRVGRITKRIQAGTAAGKKLAPSDLQSIQADAKSEWAEAIHPTLLDAAQALVEELAKPGTHAELTALVAAASPFAKSALPTVLPLLAAWSFDTPSGADEDAPTAAELRDTQAAVIALPWFSHFSQRALGDELAKLGTSPGSDALGKLLVRMSTHPGKLATAVDKTTGESILFDDLSTVPIETKRQIAAAALLDTLDANAGRLGTDLSKWRWAQLHTLTLDFPVQMDALSIPLKKEYPNGFPRHGANGTVDVGGYGQSTSDFTYTEGPAIRFVCELDPSGPKAQNALPGGESFDPASSHYRDQMELWRKNKTFNLAFKDADVLASAKKEVAARAALAAAGKDDVNRPIGRIRFQTPMH